MPLIGEGPKGLMRRVKRDIINIDTIVIRIQIEKHKSYINIPLIPTKNIKVDEETKCLAGVGKNPRRASKSSRPNSKALENTHESFRFWLKVSP
jgi:hypothetical protein